MFRVTLDEVAATLGYKRTWMYNTLPKLGCADRRFIGIETIYDLLKYSFLAGSYENYPYEKIINKKVLKLIRSGITIKELRKHITRPVDLFEILVALRINKPETAVFNTVNYACKKLGLEGWRNGFKEYVFASLWQLFQDAKIDAAVFVRRPVKVGGRIEKEIVEDIFKQLRVFG